MATKQGEMVCPRPNLKTNPCRSSKLLGQSTARSLSWSTTCWKRCTRNLRPISVNCLPEIRTQAGPVGGTRLAMQMQHKTNRSVAITSRRATRNFVMSYGCLQCGVPRICAGEWKQDFFGMAEQFRRPATNIAAQTYWRLFYERITRREKLVLLY